jgi:riboflavin-specific deaminase-like protein
MERDLIDLYLPLCAPLAGGARTVAHLGQSLDGFIATANGDSCFVTGPDNIRHLHRMRALSDGVLVGTETAACDDPRLTTRLVPGDNPVRIILDRQRRLAPHLRVFTDGAAETLLCCDQSLIAPGRDRQGQARLIGIPIRAARLDLIALMDTLTGLGLRRLFIEGGGATVSAFLAAGLLDRMQIAVAPVLIGHGRPGLRIPAAAQLADAPRPAVRLFRMGADLLYDLDLKQPGGTSPASSVTRIA